MPLFFRISTRASLPAVGRRVARRGAALIMVLVCLAAAMGAILGMLRSTIVEQKQLRTQRQNLQVDQLAEAGLARAHAQLEHAADYRGETWNVPASELGTADSAAITISVNPVVDHPERRTIKVQADCPTDQARRIRRTLDASIALDQGEQQP